MNGSQPRGPDRGIAGPLTAERLQSERRGFIIGSIVVLAVVLLTTLILIGPAVRQALNSMQGNKHPSFSQMDASMAKHEPLSADLMFIAGALGLLVLNLRFSRLIRHPRAAYRVPADATSMGARLAWLLLLVLNSLFYTAIIPEVIILALLSHWATLEIRQLRAHPPGGPGGGGATLEPWGRQD